MEGVFCETKEDALAKALSYIEEGSSVTWGGSMSISEIGLMDAVKNGNYEIIDRSVAKNYDEQREIFSKAVLADYYLMSSNAITLDGELINIDGTRVYGTNGCLTVPQKIEGMPVYAIGAYCFSASNKLDGLEEIRETKWQEPLEPYPEKQYERMVEARPGTGDAALLFPFGRS